MSSTTETTNKPSTSGHVYTRRTVATVIISFIVFSSTCLFVIVAYVVLIVFNFLFDLLPSNYRAKGTDYLLLPSTLIIAVAYLVKSITFGKAVMSPHFLFQERKQLHRSLIPPAISILCILAGCIFSWLASTYFLGILHVIEWIIYLDLLLSTLAFIAMLRPRSGNILTRCFVPFIEDEPKSITA
jgi:hypothetical protein